MREIKEVLNVFFFLYVSKVIMGLLGRGGNSQWVSQHFTHYVFNQIYTRRHHCVTGRLTVVQCGGDRRRNVKHSGNKVGWRSIPRDVWQWSFAGKHFQYSLGFADLSVQPHCIISHKFY